MSTNLLTTILLISMTCSVNSLREKCCEDLGVPEKCFKPLCNPTQIPAVMLRYKLWDPDINCHPYLIPISKCLSKGRDVSSCCYKNSYDTEFDYCFGLCNGTMNYNKEMKDPYLSCFVLNVVAMFPCFVSSYTAAPSAPRNFEIVSKTDDSVSLKWDKPEDSPELVDHYKIHLIERTGQSETETTHTTEDTEFTIEDLTTVYSYTVHVVAHGAPFEGNKDWYKSQISKIIPFVTGEQLVVSTTEIKTPNTTQFLTLYCTLRLINGAERAVDWTKVIGEDSELLDGEAGGNYSVVYYQPERKKDIIISALRIEGFDETNFASYRCFIKDVRIEYSETVVTNFDFSEQAPSDNPPDTALDCCMKHVHRTHCQSLCSKNDELKRSFLRPGQFIPPPKNCEKEMDNVFKCTLSILNCAGCCIHSKVPYHCLGLCDSRFDMDQKRVKWCKQYLKPIYACKIEAMSMKPEPIYEVRTRHVWWWSFRFAWDKAVDAKVYHIYTRKKQRDWTVKVTLDTTVDISDADEAVLVSINEFGYSEQYRLYYDSDGWNPVDHW